VQSFQAAGGIDTTLSSKGNRLTWCSTYVQNFKAAGGIGTTLKFIWRFTSRQDFKAAGGIDTTLSSKADSTHVQDFKATGGIGTTLKFIWRFTSRQCHMQTTWQAIRAKFPLSASTMVPRPLKRILFRPNDRVLNCQVTTRRLHCSLGPVAYWEIPRIADTSTRVCSPATTPHFGDMGNFVYRLNDMTSLKH
jgi:hypothetical protein